MPQNSNFRLPRGHRFLPKFDFTVKAPNHGGDPLGSILGPMGSHWVKKMGQNGKNYHVPKFEFSTTPQSSISTKIDFTVMAPNHGGDTIGSILGPMGSHWVKKGVKTVKNYHAPKFEFSTTPRSWILAKIRLYGYGAKSRCGPSWVHLGANGGPLGKTWVKTVKNYYAPKLKFSTTP